MSPEPLSFNRRADLSEWMDQPSTYPQFRTCLISLRFSNRLTFNYRPTLRWLRQFRGHPGPLHIVDVGSGGGDMLQRIERWAKREGVAVQLTGIDLNPHAARAAREFSSRKSNIQWLTGDAFTTKMRRPPDLILSSLFTHHLPVEEIVRFLRWMEETARLGWFISDLHRGRFPYVSYRLLSTALGMHSFVRHDGPISIRRAFRAGDWQEYLSSAGMEPEDAQIYPMWPARLCVSRVHRHA